MKTAFVYCSVHHGNTKKLLDAIASENQVDLIDVTQNTDVDLNVYDRIGFAFGIYYSKFHKTLIKLAEEKMPQNKKPFFVYTCGAEKEGYTQTIADAVKKKNSEIIGSYGCKGFDTFGPFKLVGGIAKGHPDEEEIRGAKEFYAQLP